MRSTINLLSALAFMYCALHAFINKQYIEGLCWLMVFHLSNIDRSLDELKEQILPKKPDEKEKQTIL